MIVTCEECSTRFNLDDALVEDGGSKVRCSVCQHVFTVFLAPLELEVESDPAADSLDDAEFKETTDFEMEDNDFSLEDSDLEFDEPGELEPGELELDGPGDLEPEEDFSFTSSSDGEDEPELQLDDTSMEEDGTLDFDDAEPEEFDGIEFETLDDDDAEFSIIQDDEPELEESPGLELEAEPEIEDDSMPDPAGGEDTDDFSAEDDFELEFDISEDDQAVDEDTEEDSSGDEELDLDIDAEAGSDQADISLDDVQKEDPPPVIAPEDDFTGYDEVLEQETEPGMEVEEPVEVADFKEKPIEKTGRPELEKPAERRRKKSKPLIGKPVLVLLLLFFMVAGAYIASLMTGYKIPYISDIKIAFIEDMIKKKTIETDDIKPIPNQKSVNGRFVTNTTAGTLFVITGTVENPSKTTYSNIEIKGALITRGKVEAKTKTVFCGNIITEDMLKTGNITDINKLLLVKEGYHNSNVNIKPGASIPFMVVFSDLPEKLQNFTVKVTKFTKP